MTWLPEHVQHRYASGHVIVIPPDHRGYEHGVAIPDRCRTVARVFAGDGACVSQCVTLRGAPICDCGMYALDWTGSVAGATNSEEAAA